MRGPQRSPMPVDSPRVCGLPLLEGGPAASPGDCADEGLGFGLGPLPLCPPLEAVERLTRTDDLFRGQRSVMFGRHKRGPV